MLSIETYDPWHSPGTMELTMRAMARRAYRQTFGSISRRGAAATADVSPVGVASGRPRQMPGLSTLARLLARAEAQVGLGNIADVIAVRR